MGQNCAEREKCRTVLDPFAGSGTVNIAADELGVVSYGYEAQPFVFRIARAKTFWDIELKIFRELSQELLSFSRNASFDGSFLENPLLSRCYEQNILKRLLQFRSSWEIMSKDIDVKFSSMLFLAITAILRPASHAGTAQWQYIQPKKTTKAIYPDDALQIQFANMFNDMWHMQMKAAKSMATIINSDCRVFDDLNSDIVDIVITSPPYANNYDYADATRFEMTFWGEIKGWGDLHEKVRKNLVCSSSQHAAKEKFDFLNKISSPLLEPIHAEISDVCVKLSEIRLAKAGRKPYHAMIAAYFADMAQVMRNLHKILSDGGKAFIVIGDSAPYGIHVPVEEWLGRLALDAGFRKWEFGKLRDRNVKWKNRKHNIPLKEGILCLYN